MVEIFFDDLFTEINNHFKKANSEIIIICPYIKSNVLEEALKGIKKNINVIVIAKWAAKDLLFGSTDLEIYPFLKSKGYKLYLHENIHLKIYIRDKLHILLGSANLTNRALGLSKPSNIEVITLIDANSDVLNNINLIMRESVLVTEDIYEYYTGLVANNMKHIEKIKLQLQTIKDYEVKKDLVVENLIVNDFPFTGSPELFVDLYRNKSFKEIDHDATLFNISLKGNINSLNNILKRQFLCSKAYQWQCNIVKDSISFGRYSELLHNSLMDSPKPYRKTVKDLVRNMYEWTKKYSNEFRVTKANYSDILQRLL